MFWFDTYIALQTSPIQNNFSNIFCDVFTTICYLVYSFHHQLFIHIYHRLHMPFRIDIPNTFTPFAVSPMRALRDDRDDREEDSEHKEKRGFHDMDPEFLEAGCSSIS
jgi:hypothetical protein